MSHHRHHHRHEHDHDERDHHRDHHRARLQQALRRHLRRHGDDVAALEELQRDLEQATADVAARITRLRGETARESETAS